MTMLCKSLSSLRYQDLSICSRPTRGSTLSKAFYQASLLGRMIDSRLPQSTAHSFLPTHSTFRHYSSRHWLSSTGLPRLSLPASKRKQGHSLAFLRTLWSRYSCLNWTRKSLRLSSKPYQVCPFHQAGKHNSDGVGYDAFQVDRTMAFTDKPPLKSSVRVMTLIHSLCVMLQTTPFHKENYSRLIIGVIVQYYQQCSDRFKGQS